MKNLKQALILLISILALASLAVIAPSLTRGQGQNAGNATLNVNVINPSVPVRDVEHPARSPFTATAGMNLFDGESSRDHELPSLGERTVVIEYVTASCELPAGQKPEIRFDTVAGTGSRQAASFPIMHYQRTRILAFGGASSDIYHASEMIKIVVTGGSGLTVGLHVSRSPAMGNASCQFVLSGYYL